MSEPSIAPATLDLMTEPTVTNAFTDPESLLPLMDRHIDHWSERIADHDVTVRYTGTAQGAIESRTNLQYSRQLVRALHSDRAAGLRLLGVWLRREFLPGAVSAQVQWDKDRRRVAALALLTDGVQTLTSGEVREIVLGHGAAHDPSFDASGPSRDLREHLERDRTALTAGLLDPQAIDGFVALAASAALHARTMHLIDRFLTDRRSALADVAEWFNQHPGDDSDRRVQQDTAFEFLRLVGSALTDDEVVALASPRHSSRPAKGA